MSHQYLIGLDFGTLSVRALLLDAQTGKEVAISDFTYPHAVMDTALPSGKKLPPRYALQHPQDYLDGLRITVKAVLEQGGVDPCEIAGLCIDFTTCTVVPMTADGTPLCMIEGYADEPHAYVKLWKHHGAIPYANEIWEIAKARDEKWLSVYGGKLSCEWMIPKVVEILREAPEIYEKAAYFADAGDWLSFLLTGEHTMGVGFAGLKTFWNAEDGFPSNDFFKAIDPRLDGIIGTKICTDVRMSGKSVGTLSAEGARLIGLCEGIPIAAPLVDAATPLPALAATKEGELALIVGTSGVAFAFSKEKKTIPGICGYVKDMILPGYYSYEAGQAGVGDVFSWFVHNCVPRAYEEEAAAKGMNIHAYLRKKASALRVGESRLIALDWFNGNRSILKDDELSGMILGLTLNTRPEEIYRALIEATAYGVRMIVENFEAHGIPIDRICVAGGIAQKDPMMMQIYADVLQKELRIAGSSQSAARGCAIYASVVAGLFSDLPSAVEHFALPDNAYYKPIPENVTAYDRLYEEYKRLHDYFGKGGNDVMKRL